MDKYTIRLYGYKIHLEPHGSRTYKRVEKTLITTRSHVLKKDLSQNEMDLLKMVRDFKTITEVEKEWK